MAPGSHTHAFHLVIARVIGHCFVMHGFHWLIYTQEKITLNVKLNSQILNCFKVIFLVFIWKTLCIFSPLHKVILKCPPQLMSSQKNSNNIVTIKHVTTYK